MTIVRVYNEDGEQIFRSGDVQYGHAWKQAERFLLDLTEQRRNDIGSDASDEEWIDTLVANGFYYAESDEE